MLVIVFIWMFFPVSAQGSRVDYHPTTILLLRQPALPHHQPGALIPDRRTMDARRIRQAFGVREGRRSR